MPARKFRLKVCAVMVNRQGDKGTGEQGDRAIRPAWCAVIRLEVCAVIRLEVCAEGWGQAGAWRSEGVRRLPLWSVRRDPVGSVCRGVGPGWSLAFPGCDPVRDVVGLDVAIDEDGVTEATAADAAETEGFPGCARMLVDDVDRHVSVWTRWLGL